MSAWTCQSKAKHARRGGICLRARGNERYRLDPIGDALHGARLRILPQIDPGVTANGRCDGKGGGLSRTNRIATDRLLREKGSRRQDQSQRQSSPTH